MVSSFVCHISKHKKQRDMPEDKVFFFVDMSFPFQVKY